MPTEIDRVLVTPIPSHARDTPPHLDNDSVSELVELKVSDSLRKVEGPIDDVPKDAKIVNYESGAMPGLFSPCHCIKRQAKLRILNVLEYRYEYLRRPTLNRSFELTRSNFKRPLLVEVFDAMERTVGEYKVISFNEEVLGAAPRPDNLRRASKLLAQMRKDYQSDIAAKGAIPTLPLWGKDNDPQEWWMINDYEVLCTAFRHEVELFLKTFVPYLSKEEKGFQPTTPWKALILPTIAEPLPLRKSKSVKNVTFPEVPPISSVTSSTRLGAMITGASA